MTDIILKYGWHPDIESGLCLMEAVAFIAGEPHSDQPKCADPVLATFGRSINDFMTDDERVHLVPFVAKLVGTVGDHNLSLRRAMLLCDGVIRQILPVAFEAIGFNDQAENLKKLGKIEDEQSATVAENAANAARRMIGNTVGRAASAAWNAAGSAADSAGWIAVSATNVLWAASRSSSIESENVVQSATRSAASAVRLAAQSATRIASQSATRKPIVDAIVSLFEAAIKVS